MPSPNYIHNYDVAAKRRGSLILQSQFIKAKHDCILGRERSFDVSVFGDDDDNSLLATLMALNDVYSVRLYNFLFPNYAVLHDDESSLFEGASLNPSCQLVEFKFLLSGTAEIR